MLFDINEHNVVLSKTETRDSKVFTEHIKRTLNYVTDV